MSLYETLKEAHGSKISDGSMLGHEVRIRPLLSRLQPNLILEIGTLRGASTCLWAEYAEKVVTIDIKKLPITDKIWSELKVDHKIEHIIVSDDEEKSRVAKSYDVDLAFVDGGHTYEAVMIDIECLQHAKAMLFHDYKPEGGTYSKCTNARFQGVVNAIHTLQPEPIIFGTTCSQFALWLNPDYYSPEERRELSEFVSPL